MGFYEFKKWFFDVNKDVNDYLIFFVSQIKLGKKYYTYFQMHGARRESNLIFQSDHSCIKSLHQKENDTKWMKFDEGAIQFENGNCKINLDCENCQINLVYKSNFINWPDSSILLSNQKKDTLAWIPLILSGSVSGSVLAHGESKTYRNATGYCDEVVSTFKPWKVPLSQLYWGRLHHEFINLSYSILQNPKTLLNVSRLYLDINGNYYVLSGLHIDIINRKKCSSMNLTYADKYFIHGYSDDLSISIEVSDHQEMIQNDFMNYVEKYGTLATGLLRWISRDPKGSKFRASANINIHINEKKYLIENIPLVDEYVEFR